MRGQPFFLLKHIIHFHLSGALTRLRVKMPQSFPQFNHISLSRRGLLEVLQLDFVPRDVSEHAESQMISWRLESPGNAKDVGIMRIYTTQRDYVGLAPLVMVRAVPVCVSACCSTGAGRLCLHE